MSVINRAVLDDSPLADLHELASELSIDGYRRLRREALVDTILQRQGGDVAPAAAQPEAEPDEKPVRRRSRRTTAESEAADPTELAAGDAGDVTAEAASTSSPEDAAEPAAPVRKRAARTRVGGAKKAAADDTADADAAVEAGKGNEGEGGSDDGGDRTSRRRRSGRATRVRTPAGPESEFETEEEAEERRRSAAARGRREEPRDGGSSGRDREGAAGRESRRAGSPSQPRSAQTAPRGARGERDEDEVIEGVVEILQNGSGFVRVSPPEPSDADAYISAAQVKRCELVSGDKVTGPKRAPRRSERFASLIRIDTVNGRPASELADSVRFDELPARFPQERIALGSDDPTLKAIEFLTPFGRGSRVTIAGPAHSGKSEALRRLHSVLVADEDLQVSLVLAGARPEEISELGDSEPGPAASAPLGASGEAQAHTVELVVDQARRVAARGAHAVVLIDSLDGVDPAAARRITAAARNLRDGGSLTIIATASKPVGGETTLICLDGSLTAQDRFPAIDLRRSRTMRPELLVGEEAAEELARTAREVHA